MAAKKKIAPAVLTQFDPLPQDFVLYKPLQREAYDENVIYELEKRKQLIITRKRDGWKLFAVKEHGDWKIYTDGLREVTKHVPHIVDELSELKFSDTGIFADKTILVGEGLVDKDDNDNFERVASILNVKTVEQSAVAQKERGKLKFMIFDLIFQHGDSLLGLPYAERLGRIERSLTRHNKHLLPVPVLQMTFDEAQALVREKKWEGLVLYDKFFTASYRLDGGSPKRHEGCYKWKPIFEDDFIVRNWIPKDDDPQALHEVLLTQIDPATGAEIDCGKHGVFDKATKRRINEALLRGETLVLKMGFEKRNPSGKLRNKWFMELRTDKRPEDCIAPHSFTQK